MTYELIDVHAHVNFNAFREDGDEVARRTLAGNVGMILVGSQSDTSRRALEYAERYREGVWAAVGLHPIHLVELSVDSEEIAGTGVSGFKTRVEQFDRLQYKTLAAHAKTVAIGECGLDYFRLDKNADDVRERQHETFREHIRLAREMRKPLIVHCRNAYDDLHRILQEEHAGDVGGTIHFFAGTVDDARKFLHLGFHLSFTGVITFAHDYDEAVKFVPLDRVMVETDAPYVAPVPHRGKRNEPLYVREVAKKVAEIKGVSFAEIAWITTENARRLFRL